MLYRVFTDSTSRIFWIKNIGLLTRLDVHFKVVCVSTAATTSLNWIIFKMLLVLEDESGVIFRLARDGHLPAGSENLTCLLLAVALGRQVATIIVLWYHCDLLLSTLRHLFFLSI